MKTEKVPVFINNRNRLSTLTALIDWLESVGTQDIFILDNASTYQPLLDFYCTTNHQVIRLRQNVGYLSFWETGIWERFKSAPYIYTDSDVVPVNECPSDYLEIFFEGLSRYREVEKVGFSLKIDDLPENYAGKAAVISHESGMWTQKRDDIFYNAPIDTTFALYRGAARGGHWVPALRSAPPLIARHMPWYVNSRHLDAEELFYRNSVNSDSTWTSKDKQLNGS